MADILRNTQEGVKQHFAYHAMVIDRPPCDLRGMLIRLREFRENLGLSLEAMAERSGFSVSQLSRWESGNNNIPSERLPPLAEAYGCRIGEIFDNLLPLPNESDLAEMIESAMGELPFGVSYADYPRAVSSSLHERLKLFQAAGGFRRSAGGESAPDKDAPPPEPTKQGDEEERRSP